MQDVTLQRRSEEARRESGALLRLVVDNMPMLINFVDTQQRYLLNNNAYRDWFGMEPETLKGRTVREVVGEENYARIRASLERVLAGEGVEYEIPFAFGDGRSGHIVSTHLPYRDSKGQVQGYISLVQDVTERRRLESEREKALEAARQAQAQAEGLLAQLETILQSFPEPLYVADAKGITRANAAGLGLLGGKSVEELNRDLAHLQQQSHVRRADTGEPLPPEDNLLVRALQGHTGFLDFIVRDLSTGRNRVMHGTGAPVRVSGQVVGAVSVSTDITERTVAEQSLRERAHFEQQLIGIVGHDLRSPLQSILLSANVLLR